MLITDLLYFDERGWCILSDVIELEGIEYWFMPIFDRKPSAFKAIPSESIEHESEVEEAESIAIGDIVFYFKNDNRSIGKVKCSRVVDIGKTIKLEDGADLLRFHIMKFKRVNNG